MLLGSDSFEEKHEKLGRRARQGCRHPCLSRLIFLFSRFTLSRPSDQDAPRCRPLQLTHRDGISTCYLLTGQEALKQVAGDLHDIICSR